MSKSQSYVNSFGFFVFSSLVLKQPVRTRKVCCLRPAFDVDAPEQAPQMHLDGVLADFQGFGNVAITHAFVEQF